MRFINLGAGPIALECEEMFLPDGMTFRTEPEIVSPGEEGEIVVSYSPSDNSPEADVKVILKNTGVPPSRSSITVRIKNKK